MVSRVISHFSDLILLLFLESGRFSTRMPSRAFQQLAGQRMRCSLLSYGLGHAFGVTHLRSEKSEGKVGGLLW